MDKKSTNYGTIDWGENFQTPIDVCEYMSSFLPLNAGKIL